MTKERAAKIILDMINGAESTFGHSLSTLEINALKKGYCALNPEPITNADRIRAMSDEELARYLYAIGDESWDEHGKEYSDREIRLWLDWLRKEAADKDGEA